MQTIQVLGFQHSVSAALPPPSPVPRDLPDVHPCYCMAAEMTCMLAWIRREKLPYMDITAKTFLAVGNQVVAVVEFIVRVLEDG